MTQRMPSKTPVSRRSFIAGIASLSTFSTVTSGVTNGLTETQTSTSALDKPPIPNAFTGDAWTTTKLPVGDNNDVAWTGHAVHNTELQEQVNNDLGVDVPLWRLYAWTLEPLRTKDYMDSGSASEDSSIPFIESVSLGYGPGAVNVDVDDISEFVDEADSVLGETAIDVFTDQLETDYPFTEAKLCTGLYNDERVTTCRRKEIGYTNAQAAVEDKFTLETAYTAETEDEEFDIEYRGLLTVQTYNRGETFVAVGGVYPEEMDDDSWWGGYEFDEDFIDDTREFMKTVN